MPDADHPIQLAARLTGLSTHVLRIWERRYHAVEPKAAANVSGYSGPKAGRMHLERS
jgi:hypothetical protein